MIPDKFLPDIARLSERYGKPNLLANLNEALSNDKAFLLWQDRFLFVFKDCSKPTGDHGLFIWIGIHKDKTLSIADYLKIERMAKHSGYKYIQFETKRSGFNKLASKHGYHAIGLRNGFTIWEKR
tara:strand:- start:155875 stop:156249 length:375 start_codon:yes stop_codon:yes gene_type:complete